MIERILILLSNSVTRFFCISKMPCIYSGVLIYLITYTAKVYLKVALNIGKNSMQVTKK